MTWFQVALPNNDETIAAAFLSTLHAGSATALRPFT